MNICYLNTPAYDYLTATIIEGLTELGHKVFTSEKSNYGFFLSKKYFIEQANKSDLFIIGSNKHVKYDYLKFIKHNKTVFVDGSDSSYLNLNFSYPINLVFKRELLKGLNFQDSLIFPLPFAAEKRYFNKEKVVKDIDVSFLAANNNFLRESIKNVLNTNFKNNSVTEHTGEISYSSSFGFPHENPIYFSILSRSKVVINIPGLGWDCGRYWEAIANKALVLSYKLEIQIPNPFEEKCHILSFSDINQFIEKIDYCLSNPNIVKNMSEEAYNHLLQFHTTTKRAEYFLKTIEENYKVNSFFNINSVLKIQTPTSTLLDKIKSSVLNRF
jgi:hypothetical protein